LQATLRQCDTGAEIPNSTFPALHTFLSGGAMISNPASSGLTTGHGVWTHAGDDNFKNTIRLFALSPGGALLGMAKVDRDIVLSPDGKSLTSDDVSEFRDPAGNLIGSRCAAVTKAPSRLVSVVPDSALLACEQPEFEACTGRALCGCIRKRRTAQYGHLHRRGGR
jgi:hypothetical protein